MHEGPGGKPAESRGSMLSPILDGPDTSRRGLIKHGDQRPTYCSRRRKPWTDVKLAVLRASTPVGVISNSGWALIRVGWTGRS